MQAMLRPLLAAGLLLAPALAKGADATPICTDRPTKANAVCTVPKGGWQIETTAVGWTRFDTRGTRTDSWSLGASVIKFGLGDRSDLQVGVVPFLDVRTREPGGNRHVSGIGDLTLRVKYRLTAPGSTVQIAVIPFVKLPVAKAGLGNRKLDGGLAVPISLAAGSATLTVGPELDVLANADGDGRHMALANLVNLAVPVAPKLTLIGELWTATNFDPAGNVTQASADAAIAFAATNRLQLDLGANLGLNRHTADLEAYTGISLRF